MDKDRFVDPKIWGKHVWGAIDAFVDGYGMHPDPELKQAAHNFFLSLEHLLPCPQCREHYGRLMKQRPVTNFLGESISLRKYVEWLKIEVEKNARKNKTSTGHNPINPAVGMPQRPKHRRKPRAFVPPPAKKRGPPKPKGPEPRSVLPGGVSRQKPKQWEEKVHNWKGTAEGLKKYKQSLKNYHRPCACY